MQSLNRIMIIGNVGTEPEMRYGANGNAVASFRLAASRTFSTGEGERRQETAWFSVIARAKLAETVNQFLTKGSRAYVEGRLHIEQWEGQDGQKHCNPEIIANTILFLDERPAAEDQTESTVKSDVPF